MSVGVPQSLKMLLPLSLTGPGCLLLCCGVDRQTVVWCEASVHVLVGAADHGAQHRREAREKGALENRREEGNPRGRRVVHLVWSKPAVSTPV